MIEYILAGIGLLLLLVIMILPALRVAPFAYGASRLRAARARFLNKKELTNLAYLGYHDSLVAIDERMDLSLSKLASESFPEEKVQRRIRQYRLQCIHSIIQYTPSNYKPFFSVLLSKETLEFIIGTIRSKLNPTFTNQVVSSMFTDVKFSVEHFSELSLDELLTELEKTVYGDTISTYRQDITNGDLEAFEKELNEMYYSKLLAAANNAILRKCANRIIDIHNIKQSLCFIPFVPVPGGLLSEDNLNNLQQASSVEQVTQALENTYFAFFVKDKSTVIEVFQGLYQSFDAYANELAKQQPLSLNQMVAYYVNNIIEIKNIRILLKLSHAKLAPESIEEAFI